MRDRIVRSTWNGVELITVEIRPARSVATLAFDAICAHDAATRGGVCLVLGYNG
ncbi:glycosyl transferase, partial [Methylobacterium radiotolerans]